MTDTILTTDSFVTTDNYGFDFAADNDTLTIEAGVLVGSSMRSGINMGQSANTLTNDGNVFGAQSGVHVLGLDGTITNNIGANITGEFDGVVAGNNGFATITNHGTIRGLVSEGLGSSDNNRGFLFNNDGSIYGHMAGVQDFGGPGPGTLNNTGAGIIYSDNYGIEVDGMPMSIYNSLHATISGKLYSIYTHEITTGFTLNNVGTMIGSIQCDAPNGIDVIVNHGAINGNINLGTGNDSYTGAGVGRVAGLIHGGSGLDRFVANRAHEAFFGDAGADAFVFNATLFSPATAQRDIIGDFSHLEADKIDVHAMDADIVHAGHQAFIFIGTDTFAHYHSLHPHAVGLLRFDSASERLQGNVNVDFAHADFEVALPNVTVLHANDFILT